MLRPISQQKLYRGQRLPSGATRVTIDGHNFPPVASWRLRDLAEDFEWGYCGAEPGQLALAILQEEAGDSIALAYYTKFKIEVIANLQRDSWRLTSAEVQDWIRAQKRTALAIGE